MSSERGVRGGKRKEKCHNCWRLGHELARCSTVPVLVFSCKCSSTMQRASPKRARYVPSIGRRDAETMEREYEKLVPCGPMDHRHRPPSSGGILTVLCSELPVPVVHTETRLECTQKQGWSGHRNKASIHKQKHLIGSSRMGNGEHPPTELVLVEKQNKTDNFIQYNKPFLIAFPPMEFFYCPPVQY